MISCRNMYLSFNVTFIFTKGNNMYYNFNFDFVSLNVYRLLLLAAKMYIFFYGLPLHMVIFKKMLCVEKYDMNTFLHENYL